MKNKNKNIIIGLIFLMLSIIFYGILTSFIGQGLYTQASLVERYLIFTTFQLLMSIFIIVAFYFIIYKKKETEWKKSIKSYKETENSIARKEQGKPLLIPCPFCSRLIPEDSQVCPYCKSDLEFRVKTNQLSKEKQEYQKKFAIKSGKVNIAENKGVLIIIMTRGIHGEVIERQLESLADSVIDLYVIQKGSNFERILSVKKIRNFAKKIGTARYDINDNGFVLENIERIL